MSEHLEWGVELTWPDGSTDIHPRGSVLDAEGMADWHNTPGNSVCSARLVVRTITTGPWRLP